MLTLSFIKACSLPTARISVCVSRLGTFASIRSTPPSLAVVARPAPVLVSVVVINQVSMMM